MKIDLTRKLIALNGEVLKDNGKDLTLGIAISVILDRSQTGGALKLYGLSKKAMTDEEMDVDTADFSLIKQCVEQSTVFTSNSVKGQVLEILEEVK